ncbi:hypothetical protein BDB00DRAFT_878190 [Zychaea mexicana]|uniref:uncharacterized protein n=1 Tax=Zychaea mexicana TaxID=64656 RepID=UPI0022FE4713|nr:uncharacterized protein BDB00DRAFT_878190 [Zychaea mexicana]KAI9484983.1 hypothetical protein BDB00DRAFT_878190 [Zychaea mexicana]
MPIDRQLFITLHKVTVNARAYLADLDDLMQIEADCEALVQQQQQQEQEDVEEEDVKEEVVYLTPTEDEA